MHTTDWSSCALQRASFGVRSTALVTVTTDKGDFILDQASDEVKLWSDVRTNH
ncbi:transglutaminase-like cysteine peptidase (plasmid) [Agrobacterium tumefaciens]|nr:transglutaminase-like cysteine peptidase [Agrobacterium tumefaciens]